MNISLIPASYIGYVWYNVKPYLEKATDETNGRYTVEDVRDMIEEEKYHLWVAYDHPADIKGAVVTCVNKYPSKSYLNLTFCGGIEGHSWKDEMLSTLREWAKDNECDGIEALGRLGWEKIFSKDGYVPSLRTFELSLG